MTDRSTNPHILPVMIERWSPRAFDGSALPQADLEVILEAAGLAPSAFNVQPWRFLYAHRGDANWDRFLSLLIPFNASWAQNAGVLLFVISDSQTHHGEDKPNWSHSFDAGAAWTQLALQATALGYHAHGMTGLEFDKARAELGLPESWRLEAAVAIGKRAPADTLPEGLRAKEMPSGRLPVASIAGAGDFSALP